jgi:DNA-directed RNA polymerase subunit RPC12/RpoP
MKYYGLNASLNQPGYECEHCKMFFRSIKDRTSLDRDACPGCQHRSAWG